MKPQVYEYWLYSIPGVGWKTASKLLEAFGSAEEIYRAKEQRVESLLNAAQAEGYRKLKKTWNPGEEYHKLQEKGIFFTSFWAEDYPGNLKHIPDPPLGIFWKGRLPREDVPAVAVIGARECSEYGRYVAQSLGKALAEAGVQVVSGMARGIDGISQEAALSEGGASFGILGSGVDICYPAQNRPLYERLLQKGGVLSPYPPGTKPAPSLFPPRNRIVSGLADVLVVVEARLKSGTLITVDMALEQGREVYVVPGRLTDRLSDGCNRLLKQGAGILLSPQDFLQEIWQLFPGKCGSERRTEDPEGGGNAGRRDTTGRGKNSERARDVEEGENAGRDKIAEGGDAAEPAEIESFRNGKRFTPLEARVLEALDFYPRSVEQIRTLVPGVPEYRQTQQILMKLCLEGEAVQAGAGYFCKKAPSRHL